MSFCSKCGAPVEDGEFCVNCGTPNINRQPVNTIQQNEKKNNKVLIVIIVVLAVLLVGTVGVILGVVVGKGFKKTEPTTAGITSEESTTVEITTEAETEEPEKGPDEVTTDSSSTVREATATYSIGFYLVTPYEGLNVRYGPGTGYSKKLLLQAGEIIYITAFSESWGYTPTWGGYVNMGYVTPNTPDSMLGMDYTHYWVNTEVGLNVRTSPSTSGSVITTLPYDQCVYVEQINGAWGYARDYGGWINLSYCEVGH